MDARARINDLLNLKAKHWDKGLTLAKETELQELLEFIKEESKE